MAKERWVYQCHGIMDDWKIVYGEVVATSKVGARQKFRKRFTRRVTSIQAFPCHLAD